jgi:hypothetical protein
MPNTALTAMSASHGNTPQRELPSGWGRPPRKPGPSLDWFYNAVVVCLGLVLALALVHVLRENWAGLIGSLIVACCLSVALRAIR